MKRAAAALMAGIRPKRLDQLRDRGQLPFPDPGRYGEFTLDHAFRLRVMARAVDGPGGGIGPDDAAKMVSNCAGWAAQRYGAHPSHLIGLGYAVWFTAAEFAGLNREGEREAWMGWHAGPFSELPEFFAAQLADPASQALGNSHVVKLLAALNATQAAQETIDLAGEFGIQTSEVRP